MNVVHSSWNAACEIERHGRHISSYPD